MNEQRDTLETRMKETFDESVDKLDGATLSKLNQGRHAALAQLPCRWNGQKHPYP